MQLYPLFLFAFATGLTPGPNNTLLLHAGARFGYSRTIPHILGICLGMASLFLVVGIILEDQMGLYPEVEPLLYGCATVVIGWIAVRIANAPFRQTSATMGERAWSFRKAAMFQWVNPKIWMMALGVFGSNLGGGAGWRRVVLVTLVFCVACIPTMSFWSLCGQRLRPLLEKPRSHRLLHVTLALLLVLSWY